MDFKLGARMLVKYPGLSLVGGIAIAFAIAAGASTYEFLTQLARPTLPLDEGDRVVGVRLWNIAANRVERRASYDVARWREQVDSIVDLGAFRTRNYNLTVERGLPEPVQVAEISASAFRVARVPPLKGRFLGPEDEHAGAAAVVVIGYDVWRGRFAGDPGVVGRNVRLGSGQSTIVGVMPEGFAFPVSHSVWVPLRLDVSNPTQGVEIQVFGRLAPGASLQQAQAELTSIGARGSTELPDTHEQLRPEVMPFAQSISGVQGLESAALMSINVFLVMFLILVGANVALLIFARAATRESEIIVRSALGAPHGRIIMQLFVEALVLGSVAAAAGLGAAAFLLRWWLRVSEIDAGGRLPFWFDASIAPETVFYAVCLTVLSAAVAGVIPAIKMKGSSLEARLRKSAVRGDGLRFGGVWTLVIVTQVAVTVAFPATTFFVHRNVVQKQTFDVGFPAAEYLSARLEMDSEAAGVGATWQELERRLASEPGVRAVTLTNRLPRTVHADEWVDVEGEAIGESVRRHRVNISSVAPNYFDALGTPVLSGRAFHSGISSPARGP